MKTIANSDSRLLYSAGKFILIKLWAPSQNSNIDIQSIVAHGFAGPRFFPCLEFQ